MCNIDDKVKQTALYIETLLNTKPTIQPLDNSLVAELPIAVGSSFDFFSGNILDTCVIFVSLRDENNLTPAQLRKQLEIIERCLKKTVVIVLGQVASYNVQRLVAQRLNFIVPQKQMFLPSLLVDLKKTKAVGEDIDTSIPPIAQCVLLYHFQIESLDHRSIQCVADLFNTSYATANRAVRWLYSKELIGLTNGREKRLIFNADKKALWEMAVRYLSNPIEKTVHTDTTIENGMESGVNALSAYSMINEENHHHYALAKETYKTLNLPADERYGDNIIEIWRYDPKLLSKTTTVDKLSLYLTLKENEDERIQIELENMIKGKSMFGI